MYIFAGFQSDTFIEMALHELEEIGIESQKIVIVEMSNQEKTIHFLDSKEYADGESILDTMAAWAVTGSLFGIIWGSNITIGPVATGLLGCMIGGAIGYFFKHTIRKKNKRKKQINYIDFLTVVRCNSTEQLKIATSIFKRYHAVSLGFYNTRTNKIS